MRIVITGAAGKIGTELVNELRRTHEVYLIDKRPLIGNSSLTADLAKVTLPVYAHLVGIKTIPWMECMKGADAVLHLAADPSPAASWSKVLRDNIEATWNVCNAASRYHVPRVVFASSNYAVKALENELAPTCYEVGGPKIGSQVSPRPLTPYGVSKAMGEFIGQSFIEKKRLQSFVAVRLGLFSATEPKHLPWRNLWIGVRDTRSLLRRCLEADIAGFEVVYGVSGQATSPYDLSHTRDVLGWMPEEQFVEHNSSKDWPT